MSIVGKKIPRVDAVAKATGRALFVDDLSFPGMLYAGVKRSPHPHAKIREIKAGKLKGLNDVYIVTPDDIPGSNVIPIVLRDWPVLAPGIVKHMGEAVALVATDDREKLEEILDSIDVDYEVLPAVFDPEEAMKGKVKVYGEDNIFATHRIRKGDVDKGFKDSDIIIENIYRTSYQEHAYLETQGMIAVPTPDGGMEIYGSMQCPFYVQKAVSEVLGIGLNRVKAIQAETGGGFGGKEDVPSLVAAQAALLAYISNRPVKLIYTREEDIISMSKRHPSIIRYRTGAKRDGTLIAVEITYIIDSGAYATLSPVVLWRGTVHAAGPYRIPNVKVDSYAVATNKVPCGAFRGFGSPQVLFACESQMDMLAEELSIDPAELRERNLLREGDTMPFGQVIRNSVGAHDTLREALRISGWKEKRERFRRERGLKRRGIGLSTIFYGVGLGAGGKHLARAGAYVQITEDGRVLFAVGTTELGQGMKTVLTQIVAEELGVSYQNVSILPIDTSRVPDSGPTVASRSTVMSGNALREAVKPLKNKLVKIASQMLDVDDKDVIFKEGWVFIHGERRMKLEEVIREAYRRREHMASQGYYVSPSTSWDDGGGDAYIVYAWATKIAEVEVDILTGEVTVLRIYSAHDVGKAVNPLLVEGQIEGGAVQGMGFALMEEIIMENGEIVNPNFSTYIIPTAKDAPSIVPIIVEKEFDKGPYGAKGFGEQPLMGIAPAIINAIHHATGVRIKELPAKPEKIFEELKKRGMVPLWKGK
jgi:CO/xanthine dehydrogenase Mo-binding subunit